MEPKHCGDFFDDWGKGGAHDRVRALPILLFDFAGREKTTRTKMDFSRKSGQTARRIYL